MSAPSISWDDLFRVNPTNPIKPVEVLPSSPVQPVSNWLANPVGEAANAAVEALPAGSGVSGKGAPSPLADGPTAPPPPPSPVLQPETQAAMDQAATTEQRKARSRASTVLTSGRGLLSGPSIARRMLLGG